VRKKKPLVAGVTEKGRGPSPATKRGGNGERGKVGSSTRGAEGVKSTRGWGERNTQSKSRGAKITLEPSKAAKKT